MKFGRLLACSVMALTFFAPAAFAQDAGDEDLGELASPKARKKTNAEESASPDRVGVFLGFGGSYGNGFFPGSDKDAGGFNFRIGRRMHSRVALELEVESFDDFDGYGPWEMGLNTKGFLLTGRWQPFLLLGLGYADGGEGTEDGAVRAGGGLDWYVSDHVVLTSDLTYLAHFDDLSDYNILSLSFGFQYRP